MRSNIIVIILFITLNSCIKDNIKLPSVITTPVTNLTWECAIAGGEVIDDGGSPVIARGVCITETDYDPPALDSDFDIWFTTDSTGIGIFSSKIPIHWHGAAGQIRNTHYFRAYATNIKGTAYGELYSFYPKSKPPSNDAIKLINVLAKATSVSVIYSTEPIPNYNIDEIGICYGTITNPTSDGNHIIASSGIRNSITINNLSLKTTYFIRGYVKNESGISYSNEISFTTGEGEISDIDGNIYQIKTIGQQIWMIENLKVSKFADGTIIPAKEDNLSWNTTPSGAYCTYDNSIYGKLYNFYSVIDNRKLCPSGWHVPSDDEWKTLEMYLGMSQIQADEIGLRGTDEGGKLKLIGCPNNGWSCQNFGATNSSVFSAIGGGYRYDNGIFSSQGLSANFWSNSETDISTALSRSISNDNTQTGRFSINKGFGLSVRCIKD
jgi:uncharacterized protein (TIGR02145 family)